MCGVLGPGAAGDLLSQCKGDVLQDKSDTANHIRRTVFDKFFKLNHTGLCTKYYSI